MTSPTPQGPQNPLEHPAAKAHGLLSKIQVALAKFKAELEEFIPGHVIDDLEDQFKKDVVDAGGVVFHGPREGRPAGVYHDDPNADPEADEDPEDPDDPANRE